MHGSLKRATATVAAVGLVVGSLGASAAGAKQLPKPKMRLRLESHQISEDGSLSGYASLARKTRGVSTPMAGVALDVVVDGVDVGDLVTDDQGRATFDLSGLAAGEHKIAVSYAGDGSTRRAVRKQGFEVLAPEQLEDEDDADDEVEEELEQTGS